LVGYGTFGDKKCFVVMMSMVFVWVMLAWITLIIKNWKR